MLATEPGDAVFVPLCGKSLDMLWIAGQDRRVVGVEVSGVAVEAFFRENDLSYTAEEYRSFVRYKSDRVEVLLGDFFALKQMDIEGARAVYDRAAIIALPPAMRKRYAARLSVLLPPGSRILLVTIEYSGGTMSGPPFSVADKEVRALYGEEFDVSLLEETDIMEKDERFKARGVEAAVQRVYLVERR